MKKTDKNSKSKSKEKERPSPTVMHTWTFLPEDLEQKILDLTGPIQLKANSIREEEPANWLSYVEDGVISHDDYSFISAFQSSQSKEERDAILEYFEDQAYNTLKDMVEKIDNVEDMQKLLILIDDMIWEDSSRLRGFKPEVSEPWKVFSRLLEFEDDFVRNLGSRLISILMVTSDGRPTKEDLKMYLNWLKNELKQDNPYLQSVARCLQKLLRCDDYRIAFMTLSGIFKIVKILSSKIKPQTQYQFSFCLWVTSFNSHLAEKMNRSGTIPVLADVLQSSPSEVIKLPRVILATFRNLLEKPREIGVRKHNALVMIQCKILTFLEKNEDKVEDWNDPEYEEDYQVLKQILQSYVADMSCFDEYYLEVKSGRLEWSMVHTSRKFWVDNAERFHDNQFELLKILISLLKTSKDNVILCIAAHDLGEYMKQYSRGKKIVEDLGGKDALVCLLGHKHPAVKYYVLKTLQVLMLNNYELFTECHNITKSFSEKWKQQSTSRV